MRATVAIERFHGSPLQRRLLLFALLAGLSLLPVLLLAPLFNAPFERDQGLYGVIARGWIQGSVPYRDLWDNKGPLLFLWYVAAFKLLGQTVVAPRLLAALGTAAAVPFVWDTARILLGPRKGILAALLFGVAFGNPFLQANANAEILMLWPLAAGFWAFTRGGLGGNQLWFVAAGILTAFAALTKQAAAGPLVGYLLWLGALAVRHPAERRRHVQSAVLLMAGALLGLAPFVAYFAAQGALYDFFYATVKFNFLFSGQNPLILKIVPPLLLDPLPLFGGLVLWLLAVVGGVRLWQRRDRKAGLILVFAVFSELAAQSMGKVSAHYNVGLLPAVAIMGAVGVDAVIDSWRLGRRRLGQVAIGCAVVSVGLSAALYAFPSAKDRFLAQYMFRDYAERSLEAPAIAQEVDALTTPNDYVYEFGRQSDIDFLADRKLASRWVHARAYGIDPKMMDEVLHDLDVHQPKLILLTYECGVTSHDFAGCENGPPAELENYLKQHYVYAGQVDYASFYLHVSSTSMALASASEATGGLP